MNVDQILMVIGLILLVGLFVAVDALHGGLLQAARRALLGVLGWALLLYLVWFLWSLLSMLWQSMFS